MSLHQSLTKFPFKRLSEWYGLSCANYAMPTEYKPNVVAVMALKHESFITICNANNNGGTLGSFSE